VISTGLINIRERNGPPQSKLLLQIFTFATLPFLSAKISMIENSNPVIYEANTFERDPQLEWNESIVDPFDNYEIFDLIRNINDPEHPVSFYKQQEGRY
jgi:hypothetical protein